MRPLTVPNGAEQTTITITEFIQFLFGILSFYQTKSCMEGFFCPVFMTESATEAPNGASNADVNKLLTLCRPTYYLYYSNFPTPPRLNILLKYDWRSPGWSWIKTEDGWKRCEYPCDDIERNNNINLHLLNINDGEGFEAGNCSLPPTKSEKEQFNNTTKSQYFYQEKWIYVHKESTRERHGYCTLGEAFNRLDFSSAIQDIRRFNYVAKLLQLIAKSQLTSLSGAAQKNYFNILEIIVRKVLEDQYNPQFIRDLLRDLSSTLCILIREVGRCVLIGNINIWISRLETILSWQEQLMSLQISPQLGNGPTLCDLPQQMKSNILFRFSDAWDIINLGQMTSSWYMLSEDHHLWKELCKYHFSEKMFCKDLIFTENGHIDWKLMFFTLEKYFPKREQYGDTLHFCRHCSILFWKDSGHPCTANDPRSCLTPVSPQHFIDLFRF